MATWASAPLHCEDLRLCVVVLEPKVRVQSLEALQGCGWMCPEAVCMGCVPRGPLPLRSCEQVSRQVACRCHCQPEATDKYAWH